MQKRTVALTNEQYKNLIYTIRDGFCNQRSYPAIAEALMLEANLGLRIGDILSLRLNSIIRDGERYRLDIVEQKTKKARTFTVPNELLLHLQQYCLSNGIRPDERIFPISERRVQQVLASAADYLDYKDIGTHSFRKFYATNIYLNNNNDLLLTQRLLQHSSPDTTQRYIGIGSEKLENAIKKNLNII